MKRKNALTVFFIAVLVITGVIGCTKLETPAGQAAQTRSSAQQDALTFKFGFLSSQPLTDKAHGMIADEIEALSQGKMKVDRYLQGQLYTADADGSIAVSEGTLDMIVMGDLMIAAAAPEIAGFTFVPFAFDSKAHTYKFWNAISEKANAKMLEKYGVRILFDSLSLRGPRVITSNKPIKSAADFKGLKMRLPSIAASVAAFETLGCSTVTCGFGELYGVLQNGTAQACESPLSTLDSISIYEVQKYAILTDHQFSFRAAHVNEKWWQSLAAEQQGIIKTGIKKGFDYFNDAEENGDAGLVEKWKGKGMTIIPRSEIDIDSIKNTCTPAILEKYKTTWDMSVWDLIQSTRS
jgi:TRAP-type C4-dicarboxylate transport system substrate-binding protein